MSSAPLRSPALRPHRMKKDESFLGKLGGTLARKKKAKEGECARRRPPAAPAPLSAPRDPCGRPTRPARPRAHSAEPRLDRMERSGDHAARVPAGPD